MIDIHILTTSRLPKEWTEQCISSVQEAIKQSPIEVALHFLPEDTEDFWKARWDGYYLGESEWVSYVDLDDWVDPSLFKLVVPHLTDDIDSLQTQGYDYHTEYKRTYPSGRGMRFHRRSLLVEADRECAHRCCPSCHLFHTATNRTVIEDRLLTMRVGYNSLAQQWRHGNGVD